MSVRSKPRHYDWAISASRRSHSAISSPLANLRSRTVNLLDSITGGAADEQEEALARRRADEIKAFTCRACGIPYAGAEALSAHLTLFPDHTKTDGKAFQRMPTRTRSVPLIAANELRGLVEVGSPTRLEDPSAATVLPASPTSAGFTYRSLHFDDSSVNQLGSPTTPHSPPSSAAPILGLGPEESRATLAGKASVSKYAPLGSPTKPRVDSSSASKSGEVIEDSKARVARQRGGSESSAGVMFASRNKDTAPLRSHSIFGEEDEEDADKASGARLASGSPKRSPFSRYRALPGTDKDRNATLAKSDPSSSPSDSPPIPARGFSESSASKRPQTLRNLSSWRTFGSKNVKAVAETSTDLQTSYNSPQRDVNDLEILHDQSPFEDENLTSVTSSVRPGPELERQTSSNSGSRRPPPPPVPNRDQVKSRPAPPPPPPPPPAPRRRSTNPFLREDALAQLQLRDEDVAAVASPAEGDVERPFVPSRSRNASESSEGYVPKSPSNPFARSRQHSFMKGQ